MRCIRCEKLRHNSVARTLSLIAHIRPVLHRALCSNEIVSNACKHYQTHQISHFLSRDSSPKETDHAEEPKLRTRTAGQAAAEQKQVEFGPWPFIPFILHDLLLVWMGLRSSHFSACELRMSASVSYCHRTCVFSQFNNPTPSTATYWQSNSMLPVTSSCTAYHCYCYLAMFGFHALLTLQK